jgi:WS/DGAT/MGAT family acyltransferase
MNDPTTTTVSPLDAGWLWLESGNHPMHATLVCVFDAPRGAKPGYVGRLVAEMRRHTTAAPPFDRRLKASVLSRFMPTWEITETIDTRYHVRHHALPAPGSTEQLDDLVSALHTSPLDKAHPLWAIHVIEGVQGGGFAVVGKMHHALMDGVGAARLVGDGCRNRLARTAFRRFGPLHRGRPPFLPDSPRRWRGVSLASHADSPGRRPACRRGRAAGPTRR